MDQERYGNGPCFGRPVVASASTSATMTPLRPGTPNTDNSRNPSGDNDTSSSHRRGAGGHQDDSRPSSSYGSSSAVGSRFEERSQRYFHSRRVRKGEVDKAWLEKKEGKERWVTILPILGILVGLGISGFLVYDGLSSVVHHKYCPVMDETFDGGLNGDVWTKEVSVGGFGNGEFEQTTGGDENVLVQDGRLVIRATLQEADKVEKDHVIDLLRDGTCTSKDWYGCVAATNTTSGNSSIVPPTKSGRVNTKKGARLKYGRVEVTARLPEGDWLWPSIWMMPVRDTYGAWPSSGEIDIMESRGNNWTYEQGGNDVVSSALHWGPDAANDAWWRTNNRRKALRTTYGSGFNTFGLEWSQKYLFTYVNSRLLQVLYTNFDRPMWERGRFPALGANGTRLADVWSQSGRDNTPFDQEFYLIIHLGVGGTNGWFQDGKSAKPWLDQSKNAKKDFWNARESWLPTWKRPQLEVSRVVMMQQCDGNEEL
ncbi:glucan 1,3-beta-glucosidase [Drechmeria coniospora]|uniref:Glucan 1,3-beta-glucosidase n=1 Tax=Drechmeria coniospora TaxID=98403 RepID=A0A151GUW3_DRECN|nr:glucan 1,3-beta-glucosidase [Drechmeria coniospora]KYK60904.1 glucan 1,3-beta-glucosidase [Drechmeria coniospora]ODA83592.1 hypothetical protein RJ55_02107 [Drechmeria coniospora]